MMNRLLPGIVLLIMLSECAPNRNKSGNEIQYRTDDGVLISGDLYLTDRSQATILLFHQGGSNGRAEYGPIIPRLLDKKFNVLSIDQRVGGQIYGNYNRTVARIALNEFGYCDALADLRGALDYLNTYDLAGPKILWGSSYSAALVIQLATDQSLDVDRVLAFSPSSNPARMEGCHPNQYFSQVQIPLLVLRPQSELSERNTTQLEEARRHGHQTYVAQHGTHGSSMLVEARVGHEVNENWEVVERFLDQSF